MSCQMETRQRIILDFLFRYMRMRSAHFNMIDQAMNRLWDHACDQIYLCECKNTFQVNQRPLLWETILPLTIKQQKVTYSIIVTPWDMLSALLFDLMRYEYAILIYCLSLVDWERYLIVHSHEHTSLKGRRFIYRLAMIAGHQWSHVALLFHLETGRDDIDVEDFCLKPKQPSSDFFATLQEAHEAEHGVTGSSFWAAL